MQSLLVPGFGDGLGGVADHLPPDVLEVGRLRYESNPGKIELTIYLYYIFMVYIFSAETLSEYLRQGKVPL